MDVAARTGAAVLAVTTHDEDRVALERIFSSAGWRFHHTGDPGSAVQLIEAFGIPVVICDAQMDRCSWQDLHAHAAKSPVAPAVIIAARSADDCLWAEVLNVGGFDVLAKPFEKQEVLWAARTAFEEWAARREKSRAQSA